MWIKLWITCGNYVDKHAYNSRMHVFMGQNVFKTI